MKAIVLAAGEAKRMRPLTNHTPKALLKVGNKTLLEHIVSRLPAEINEIVLVVGYLGEQITDYCGDNFLGRKIQYVVQKKSLGTFHALKFCEALIKPGEKFLLMYADDIHGQIGIEKCLKFDCALLIKAVADPREFGVVVLNSDQSVAEIIEKPAQPPTNLVSTGVLLLDDKIFKYEVPQRPNGEYCLVDAVAQMIKDGQKVFAVESTLWIPIGYPEDLIKAEKILKETNN